MHTLAPISRRVVSLLPSRGLILLVSDIGDISPPRGGGDSDAAATRAGNNTTPEPEVDVRRGLRCIDERLPLRLF